MTNPKITRRQIIKGAAAVGALGAVGLPSAAFAEGDEGGGRIRWDLIELEFPDFFAGGDDSAFAEDGSKLTLTGSGTFRPGHRSQVTGGGDWNTTNPVPTSGTYRVTELVSWVRAPGGVLGTPLVDHIGNRADATPGLAVLRIRYSDGLDGALVVSCNLLGTPSSVNEGINATRGFVNFFKPDVPGSGKHSNRTVFHLLNDGDEG